MGAVLLICCLLHLGRASRISQPTQSNMETACLNRALPLLLLLALLAAIAGRSDATQCYDCSGDEVHNNCEYDVANTGRPVVCIPGESCATRRVTYVSSGAVFSFQRGCMSTMVPVGETPNKCDSDSPTFQTCTSVCDGEMCNVDSGVPVVAFKMRRNEGSLQAAASRWLSIFGTALAVRLRLI